MNKETFIKKLEEVITKKRKDPKNILFRSDGIIKAHVNKVIKRSNGEWNEAIATDQLKIAEDLIDKEK